MISEEIYSLIGSESFIMVNKKVLRILKGRADAAVMLIELVNIHKMVSNKMNVDEYGYFRLPYNWIKKVVGMSSGKQKTCLKFLEEEGLVDSMLKGYPSTRHVALNFFNIKTLLEMDETTKEDIQRAEFYEKINEFINTKTVQEIFGADKVFGNMKETLRETIKLIAIYFKTVYFRKDLEWKSRDVGVLRDFINKKSLGKPFDYAFIAKVLKKTENHETMTLIIEDMIRVSRETVENSPADQVFRIKELI